jgi:hypothetical protein
MKKQLLTLLIFFTMTCLSFGQRIEEVFKAFPLDYLPELTVEAKDSLIQNGTYAIPGGDEIESLKCDYTSEKDFIQLIYSYPTGQSGFFIIELRKFQKIDGSLAVVYAKFGGTRSAYDQHTLLTFDYQNKLLTLNENLGLPETIEPYQFLKDNLPDSVKTESINLNTSYNLVSDEANSIEYLISPETSQSEEWIKTDRFLFTWNGERFEKSKNIIWLYGILPVTLFPLLY